MLFESFVEKTGLINPERSDKYTPFHFACQEGHLDICKFIIQNLDNKNPKDNGGTTPLYIAAEYGHLKYVN